MYRTMTLTSLACPSASVEGANQQAITVRYSVQFVLRERSIQGQQRARAEGKRIGRPPVLTPEARQEVERKLREGQSVNRIAQAHRVHHSVVRRVAQELDDVDAWGPAIDRD